MRRRVQYSPASTASRPGSCSSVTLSSKGEWDLDRLDQRPQAFDRANRQLRKELADVEERTRRRDILLDDEAVFEFYDRRIPAEVCTQRDFESWWKKRDQPRPRSC
jgi:ATP-dependent helicase HrpA